VVQGQTFIDHEEYARIEGRNGKVFVVYSDIDLLERHMKELAPEDSGVIEDIACAIRTCINLPMPVEKAPEIFGPMDRLRIMKQMLHFLGFWKKWGKVTIKDVARRFKNPFMREAFPYIFNLQNPPDFPILAVFTTLGWMDQKTAGYLLGGSLELARVIERRYLDLGGEIHYKSKVIEILTENDRAAGIRLARSFNETPPTVTGIDFPLDEPIVVGGQERKRLSVQIYNFDPGLAPEGKTFVRVMFPSDYDYWKELIKDPASYEEENKQIADIVVASLDRRFPGLADGVEMLDVATPLTFERYTGNWRGSFQGWRETTKTLMMRMSKTLPGLKNFYMAGQWVEPGGSLPTAVMSGRNVTQIICKRDKKSFVTEVP
jgi:phytoene dehydrogenase-like protein